MTDHTPEAAWATAFAKAQGEFPEIPKNKTADAGKYGYTYADIADVIKAVRPALAKNGLAVAQDVKADADHVSVTTRIYHSDGHKEEFGPCSLSFQGDAQKAGAAITYARRYALGAALAVAAEEDKDAQGSSEWGTGEAKQDGPACEKCGSAMWDNRQGKKNPKAPDYKCKNKDCGHAVWLNDSEAQSGERERAASPSPEPRATGGEPVGSPPLPNKEPYIKALDEAVTTKHVVRNVTLDSGKVLAKLNTLALKNDLPPVAEVGSLPADVWKAIESADVRLLELACKDLGLNVDTTEQASLV